MSLINKMLRDLDARHANNGQTALPDEVRPLPEEVTAPRVSRRVWILAGLAILSAAAIQTSALWLPMLAEIVTLPPSLLPAPAVVAPAPPPAPTTVVLQLPPPEQMLPLPVLPETPAAAAEAGTEQAPGAAAPPAAASVAATAPAPAAQPAIPAVADSRPPGLKIDTSLPEMKVSPAPPPPAAPSALPARPPRKATPEPKPPRTHTAAKIEKQQNLSTPQERAEASYRKGVAAYKIGHYAEAANLFKEALAEDPRHLTTRQTLLAMLAEQKQWDEIQVLLREGLELMPEQIAWTMALARIQVERGRLPEAWETLRKYMAYGEKSADYQGFAGVLLQRMHKPHEAALYYLAAVQLKPNEGRWWLGLGLAYESEGKAAEAREAFQRARNSSGLTPEMAAAIDRKLR